MKTYPVLLSFLACFASACAAADLGERLPSAVPHSLVRVLASPKEFVGKPISIAGVFSWGFEDELLFLTFDHYAMYDDASAMRLTLDESRCKIRYADLEPLRGYRVKLEGFVVEERLDSARVKAAIEAGYAVLPRYYFKFSRIYTFGLAGPKVN